ncbi:MAG: phosphoadenosine phosphosulfate reductase family protein, partial [Theionarchaea archaeon]|nr:phosphoadenosine phosphosulfate reductase family protein [Theionarchaea archaeon]
MPGPVYLGRIQVNWCDQCNLPMLEEATCSCGSRTRRVGLTPPGDAYPAVGESLRVLRETLDGAYGTGAGLELLPEDKVILLNNIPSVDRAIEVIVDGLVVGRSFYEPGDHRWAFKPTMEGGKRLSSLTKRKKITVDDGAAAAILRGGSLLAPGIIQADKSIRPGDEVLINRKDGKVFAVGSARMAGEEMVGGRGMSVKIREFEETYSSPRENPGGQTWDEATSANEVPLARREEEAVSFIREVSERRKMPKCVAFSGGKDSLAVLLLVSKAITDFDVIFVDTGIEFPETVEYTERVIDDLGFSDRLIIRRVGEGFWRAMELFGPPARDARWCCKVCKLGPTTSIIQENYSGECLTFVGQRRYESQQRQSRGRVGRNPWVPGQVSASPIRNWTALHVWLYAFREGAEMNPLYFRAYARIGCFVCPASEVAELDHLAETHPEMHKRLMDEIDRHGSAAGMPESWWANGLWRWRLSPPWAGEADVAYEDPFEYISMVPLEEKVDDTGAVLSGKLDVPFEVERVSNALAPLGEARMDGGSIRLESMGVPINIDKDGKVEIGPTENGKLLRELGRRLTSCIVKASHCVGCGTCVGSCHRGAID